MSNKLFGMILAAGFSSRMDDFKPLMRFDQKTFIEHIIDKLSVVCEKITIVTGFNGTDLEREVRAAYLGNPILKKIDFIRNENFDRGMFSSVQAGLKAILPGMSPDDHVMLHLVDQPHISEIVYEKLAHEAHCSNHDILMPSYNMKAGHPIIIKRNIVEKIIDAPVSDNLRDVLQKFHDKIRYIKISDESVMQDVNTKMEVEKYLR